MAAWPYNTGQWRRLRLAKLSDEPLCQPCLRLGRVVVANTVDHRLAISQGGDPFPSLDDLESCCAPCHSEKTARSAEHGAIRSNRPLKGSNRDGSPLDPKHPWNVTPGGGSQDGRTIARKTAIEPSDSISFSKEPT